MAFQQLKAIDCAADSNSQDLDDSRFNDDEFNHNDNYRRLALSSYRTTRLDKKPDEPCS